MDDPVQLGAVAAQARPELVDQDRQALPEGQPQGVVDDVQVDRRAGVGHGQRVLAPSGAALDGGERPGPHGARLACDRLLADERGKDDRAARVAAERGEARVVDPQHQRRLLAGGDVQGLDHPYAGAGDLHVPPLATADALSKMACTL